jgi:hypothetical protein
VAFEVIEQGGYLCLVQHLGPVAAFRLWLCLDIGDGLKREGRSNDRAMILHYSAEALQA